MTQNEDISSLGDTIKESLLKYEMVLVCIIIFVTLIKYFHLPFSGIISTLVLSTIGIFYFFSAFASITEPEATVFDHFVYKLCALSSAIAIIGILFTLQHWPGSFNLVAVGVPLLLLTLGYTLYQKNNKPELNLFNKWVVIRIIVIVVIVGGLLYGRIN